MKLSMKSRYGLRALIDLTINSKTEQVALNSIAERNKISPQYLEQVFASLRKAGIVKSIKGSQGGYFLSRPPQEITVSSIIEALEGDYRIEDEELPKEGKYTGSVKAIQKLADKEGVSIYNLGTGNGYSVLQVVHAFEKACGHPIKYQIKPRRPGDIAKCYCAPEKAKKELGWEAEYGIEDMCADSWRWQSQNPNGYND